MTLRPVANSRKASVGEWVIHGRSLFQGYWRQPEATVAAFVEIDGRRFF
jgi:fatty-acyl-CoA synthase